MQSLLPLQLQLQSHWPRVWQVQSRWLHWEMLWQDWQDVDWQVFTPILMTIQQYGQEILEKSHGEERNHQ